MADQFVALDVIISQGIQHPRFSGLVTTYFIDDLDGQRHFTVAFSFPHQVSGRLIVDAAEVHHFCASPTNRQCSIHHGWIEIPIDDEPRHRMRPGHAFVITVPNDPPLGVAMTSGASATASSIRSFGLPTGTAEEFHLPADHPEDDDPEDVPPSPSTYMGLRVGDMFNCHIYRLRHPPLHIFLNHAAGVPMLQDLARRMGIVPTSLLQAHPVRAQMVGDRMNDWSFIVQSVTDLPAASSDALIILDVEVHFHPLTNQLSPLPAAARRVCRVPRHLARDAVLAQAGVAHYCRQQPDRCLVQLNGVLWPLYHDPWQLPEGYCTSATDEYQYPAGNSCCRAIDAGHKQLSGLSSQPSSSCSRLESSTCSWPSTWKSCSCGTGHPTGNN